MGWEENPLEGATETRKSLAKVMRCATAIQDGPLLRRLRLHQAAHINGSTSCDAGRRYADIMYEHAAPLERDQGLKKAHEKSLRCLKQSGVEFSRATAKSRARLIERLSAK